MVDPEPLAPPLPVCVAGAPAVLVLDRPASFASGCTTLDGFSATVGSPLLSQYSSRRSPYRCISSAGMTKRKSFNSRNCSSSWLSSCGGRPPTLAYREFV